MAPFAIRGLGSLAFHSASRWMRAGAGRTKRGQNCVRNEDLNYLFKALARTAGFLSVAMVLRAEFIIAWWRIIALQDSRFPLEFNSV